MKFVSSGLTTAIGVSRSMSPISKRGIRPSESVMIQCSPSFAWRVKIGVTERSEREPEKGSVVGTRRTVAGSSCGSQTSGAVSACSCGSKGKAQSPANSYPFHRSAFSTANGGAVILLIVRISPQVLPRKFPEIVFVHMSIGGRRPRIGCRRHRVVSAKLSDGLTATPGAKR